LREWRNMLLIRILAAACLENLVLLLFSIGIVDLSIVDSAMLARERDSVLERPRQSRQDGHIEDIGDLIPCRRRFDSRCKGSGRLGATRFGTTSRTGLRTFKGQDCIGLDFHSAFHAADQLNAQLKEQ
jgi:hypothetical protein